MIIYGYEYYVIIQTCYAGICIITKPRKILCFTLFYPEIINAAAGNFPADIYNGYSADSRIIKVFLPFNDCDCVSHPRGQDAYGHAARVHRCGYGCVCCRFPHAHGDACVHAHARVHACEHGDEYVCCHHVHVHDHVRVCARVSEGACVRGRLSWYCLPW